MSRWGSQRRVRVAVLGLLLVQLGSGRVLQAQGTVDDVASHLICLCGCNKLLNVCEMDTAQQMKAIISEKLAGGWDKRKIIEYMTATYGEQVLAAPTKRGFNLTAWITPFGLILLGSVVLWVVLAAWVQHRRTSQAKEAATVLSEDLESRYGTMLESELRDFDG